MRHKVQKPRAGEAVLNDSDVLSRVSAHLTFRWTASLYNSSMKIDLHTHILPREWPDLEKSTVTRDSSDWSTAKNAARA